MKYYYQEETPIAYKSILCVDNSFIFERWLYINDDIEGDGYWEKQVHTMYMPTFNSNDKKEINKKEVEELMFLDNI